MKDQKILPEQLIMGAGAAIGFIYARNKQKGVADAIAYAILGVAILYFSWNIVSGIKFFKKDEIQTIEIYDDGQGGYVDVSGRAIDINGNYL